MSVNSRIRMMENELRMWWQISSRAWEVVREDPQSEELKSLWEETQAIVMHTDWPLLKSKIQARLDSYDIDKRELKSKAAKAVMSAMLAVAGLCVLHHLPKWIVVCDLLV